MDGSGTVLTDDEPPPGPPAQSGGPPPPLPPWPSEGPFPWPGKPLGGPLPFPGTANEAVETRSTDSSAAATVALLNAVRRLDDFMPQP